MSISYWKRLANSRLENIMLADRSKCLNQNEWCTDLKRGHRRNYGKTSRWNSVSARSICCNTRITFAKRKGKFECCLEGAILFYKFPTKKSCKKGITCDWTTPYLLLIHQLQGSMFKNQSRSYFTETAHGWSLLRHHQSVWSFTDTGQDSFVSLTGRLPSQQGRTKSPLKQMLQIVLTWLGNFLVLLTDCILNNLLHFHSPTTINIVWRSSKDTVRTSNFKLSIFQWLYTMRSHAMVTPKLTKVVVTTSPSVHVKTFVGTSKTCTTSTTFEHSISMTWHFVQVCSREKYFEIRN